MSPNVPAVPKRTLRGALVLSALALAATEAFASTAANTTITNTATVSYNDAGGVAQAPVTASASVTVTLVPSAVVLSSPPADTIAQGTSATLTYTITATANGPDAYALSATATPNNVSLVAVGFPGGASISLGGTTLAADAADGANSVTVPYDGTGDGVVNGIAIGDTVVIGGNAYVVASVTEDALSNTTAVGLTAAISGGDVLAGNIVGERATFTASVPSGTIVAGGSGTQTVSTTATSATAPNPATTQATPTVVTVNRPTLTVAKTVSTDGGTSFAAAGSAPPGTVLVYKVVAANGGTTDATSVAFTDAIPAYLTYVAGSGKFATDSTTTYAAATALTEGAGGYTFAGGTVAYDPGGATGTVAGGGELVLFYQATIN
jgi:uncharacterized repeat protein (TIGR01451 family)